MFLGCIFNEIPIEILLATTKYASVPPDWPLERSESEKAVETLVAKINMVIIIWNNCISIDQTDFDDFIHQKSDL